MIPTMASSDRSRSPAPERTRPLPQGQVPTMPFFPRWCGPMGTAVRTLHSMPRPQDSALPQDGGQRVGTLRNGLYLDHVTTGSSTELECLPSFSTNSTKCASTTYSSLSRVIALSSNSALLTHSTNFSVTISATFNWHSTISPSTSNRDE